MSRCGESGLFESRHSVKNKKLFHQTVKELFVVGVTGFEPTASWSRTKRATNCATPRQLFYYTLYPFACQDAFSWIRAGVARLPNARRGQNKTPPEGGALYMVLLLGGVNRNLLTILAQTLEADNTVGLGKQRVIATDTDVGAGVDVGAALADQDVAGQNELTVYAVACGKGFPADGRTDLFTPENTGKSHNRHETCHCTSGHPDSFP